MQPRYPCLRWTETLPLILVYVRMFIGSVLSSDCEWNVTAKNYCPEYGSTIWNCLAWYKGCHDIGYTVYHCARDYNNQDKFTDACANEQDCRLGKEPRIRHDVNVSATSTITCELCFGNRYNDIGSRSSATFWRCPKEQPQFTTDTHFINCNYTSTTDLKSKRQWARCDTEHNYIPEANDTVYDSIGCSNDKDLRCKVESCPDGQKLVQNYTCVPSPVKPVTTTIVTQKTLAPAGNTTATTHVDPEKNDTNDTLLPGVIIAIVIVVILVVIIAIVLLYRNRECIREQWLKMRSNREKADSKDDKHEEMQMEPDISTPFQETNENELEDASTASPLLQGKGSKDVTEHSTSSPDQMAEFGNGCIHR